jgi:hypothetical protein
MFIIAGFVILEIWALFANTQVTPNWFGAFCSVAIFYIAALVLVAMKSQPLEGLKVDFRMVPVTNDSEANEGGKKQEFKYMTDAIAKNAWLNAKLAFH